MKSTSLSLIGANALCSYSSGSDNTAAGYQALFSNTTGSNNIAEGYHAGYLINSENQK